MKYICEYFLYNIEEGFMTVTKKRIDWIIILKMLVNHGDMHKNLKNIYILGELKKIFISLIPNDNI